MAFEPQVGFCTLKKPEEKTQSSGLILNSQSSGQIISLTAVDVTNDANDEKSLYVRRGFSVLADRQDLREVTIEGEKLFICKISDLLGIQSKD